MIKTEQEIDNLKKEEEEVVDMMKGLQTEYLEKGVITKAQFTDKYEKDKEHISEIEEQIELLTEKLEVEKVGKKYKFLNKVNEVSIIIGNIFRRLIERFKIKDLDKEKWKESKKELVVKKGKEEKRNDEYKGKTKDKPFERPWRRESSVVREPIKKTPTGIKKDGAGRAKAIIPKKKEDQKTPIKNKPVGRRGKEKYLLQDEKIKKKREDVYKMLKEEHGLDLDNEDEK